MWPPDAPPEDLQIPARLAWEVRKHFFLNAAAAAQRGRAPLILGVHGQSGEGKTIGCQMVFKQLGVYPFFFGSGELEDRDAGVPATRLRDLYRQASLSVVKGHSKAAVVFINDLDTAIGDWGERYQYTVNTQTVIAELMYLCDNPYEVAGQPVQRVPIVVTGNDFTRLYAPLLRLGRMRLLEWVLTPAERTAIVGRLFPWLLPAAWAQLAHRYADQPLSLFADVLLELRGCQLQDLEQQIGAKQLLQDLRTGERQLVAPQPTLDEVLRIADDIAGAATPVGHLLKPAPHAHELMED